MDAPPHADLTGLILTGGGARAAYQVGVLKGIAHIQLQCGATGNPFPIITGTSAGAMNAAALACRADDFQEAVASVVMVWENVHAEQVYRSDSLGVARSGAGWLSILSLGRALARWRKLRPKSLLDNTPLASLLEEFIAFGRLESMLSQGHLHALAVSASSYSSGQHVTFYQTHQEIAPWSRSQRFSVAGRIEADHLLASAAIPFVFPAIPLTLNGEREYFGDGSMRQAAPISPAIHLGAHRVLVVGAGRLHEPTGRRMVSESYPTLAQIAGHALSNIFLDALAVDVERVQRVNHTLQSLPPEALRHTGLRPVEVLVIAPSQRLDDIASRHVQSLPVSIRAMLRALGVTSVPGDARGAALASYLLFESDYTRELIALGFGDTLSRQDDVERFFQWR